MICYSQASNLLVGPSLKSIQITRDDLHAAMSQTDYRTEYDNTISPMENLQCARSHGPIHGSIHFRCPIADV